MPATLIDTTDGAVPVYVVHEADFRAWLAAQTPRIRAWLVGAGFKGKGGQTALFPGENGAPEGVVYIPGGDEGRGGPWAWASLQVALPKNIKVYFAEEMDCSTADDAGLGFAFAAYRYDRYRQGDDETEAQDVAGPFLVWPQGADRSYVHESYGAAKLVRDLINTPASDLGPAELARAACELAQAAGATYRDIVGVDLIREGFPAIYAVGRGAEENRAPRLIDMSWQRKGGRADAPRVTLVGKGVCFDSGGLDMKPASAMKLMKKDMGGAAHALGLASMIMADGLDVRLRVLIPAVENSVSSTAMRPLDVVATRKGLSVEIGHTDAEGRVILADALALASEDKPDLILDFATLTGAARMALGTEIPALFCNDNEFSQAVLEAGEKAADPLWRLPLWRPYRKQTEGKVADLRNDTDSSHAGAIMAALFLEAFVDEGVTWAHMDLMGWNVSSQPGRPEGGEAMGLRALFAAVRNRYGN